MTTLTVDPAITPLTHWVSRVLAAPVRLSPLAGDGGQRTYFRVENQPLVALNGPDPAENLAWLRIGRHLWFQGHPLPRIRAFNLAQGFFLLDDLGTTHLADTQNLFSAYPQAVTILAKLHHLGLGGFNPNWGHQTKIYNAAMAEKQEIGYFLNYLVGDYLQCPRPNPSVWREARSLAALVAPKPEARVLIHRDYQARNLMLLGGQVHLIDWQGARPGPAAYDLASLLHETPQGDLTPDLKENLIELYLKTRPPGPWQKTFRQELQLLTAVRLMQALGAYGRLTLKGKTKFAPLMAPAAQKLADCFRLPGFNQFPALGEIVAATHQKLAASPQTPLLPLR